MSHLQPQCFVLPGIATGPPNNYEILSGPLSDYLGVGIYNNYVAFKISEITDSNEVISSTPNINWTDKLRKQLKEVLSSRIS